MPSALPLLFMGFDFRKLSIRRDLKYSCYVTSLKAFLVINSLWLFYVASRIVLADMPDTDPSLPYNTPGPSQPTMPPTSQEPDAETDPEESQEEKKSSKISSIISTIILFAAAPLLAIFLIVFVIQSYEVDGPSMQNTLHNKDLLIVSKIPRSLSRITGHAYIPPRYQIIIFSRDELGNGGQSTRQLVKRVIGLPGESVEVKDGVVTVYNQQHPNGFNPDEGQAYAKSFADTPGDVPKFAVPENEVFVMGDNRHNSLDSRYFGPVRSQDIVGKLGVRIFPLNKAQTF